MAGQHGNSDGNGHGGHVPGTMDTTVQEKTFDGFTRMVTRTTIVILVALVLLALVNA